MIARRVKNSCQVPCIKKQHNNFQSVLNDELPIDTAMSKKLADFFGMSDMFFFNTQQDIYARNSVAVSRLVQRDFALV